MRRTPPRKPFERLIRVKRQYPLAYGCRRAVGPDFRVAEGADVAHRSPVGLPQHCSPLRSGSWVLGPGRVARPCSGASKSWVPAQLEHQESLLARAQKVCAPTARGQDLKTKS